MLHLVSIHWRDQSLRTNLRALRAMLDLLSALRQVTAWRLVIGLDAADSKPTLHWRYAWWRFTWPWWWIASCEFPYLRSLWSFDLSAEPTLDATRPRWSSKGKLSNWRNAFWKRWIHLRTSNSSRHVDLTLNGPNFRKLCPHCCSKHHFHFLHFQLHFHFLRSCDSSV